MSDLPKILHLVDDTTPGGVMRVITHMQQCEILAQTAEHVIRPVRRGRTIAHADAAVIVSHLSLNWRGLPALIALRARRGNAPLVHVEHSYTEHFTALNVRNKARFFTLLRTAFALFDHVIAVSEAQASWIWRRELLPPASLRVISPMVDLSRFRALPAPGFPPRKIGAIGRLDVQKGFDVLIAAFRQMEAADISLHIYGDGPDAAKLRDLARGDPRITFHGYVAEPEAACAAVDAVAMPSRWEAYGLVGLEARAARRPLIMSRVDGLIDQTGDGCLPVHRFSVEAWRDALTALISGEVPLPDASTEATAEVDFASRWGHVLSSICPDIPLSARL